MNSRGHSAPANAPSHNHEFVGSVPTLPRLGDERVKEQTEPAGGGNVSQNAVAQNVAELTRQIERLNIRIDRLFDKTNITAESVLTEAQFAEHLGVTTRTIRRHIAAGMPTLCNAKGYVRIRYGDALAWITRHSRRRRPT